MNDTVPAEGENSQPTPSEAPVQQPPQAAPNNPDSDFRKKFYAEHGKRIALENEFKAFKDETTKFMNDVRSRSQEEEDVNHLVQSGYDPEEARKIAKAANLINNRKSNAPYVRGESRSADLPNDPERDAFLQKHPEAYMFIDEINNIKNLAPSRKYESIAQSLGYIEAPQQNINSFRNSGDSPQPSAAPSGGKMTQAEEDAEFDKEVDKLFGRKR